jgi:leucyl/phenylalanyl-tRNA--protein transferase
MSDYSYLTEDELLEPENMIRLYARGAFPMADDSGKIDWYFPERRTIIPLNAYNVPRSLKKIIGQSEYRITHDTAEIEVIKNCADRERTWISPKLISAYKNLITNKYLHSVEVWEEEELIGGLYGIAFKGAFFGESMFSKKSQASKIALVNLLGHLCTKGFMLLDVQYQTHHLRMFGAVEISLTEFSNLLEQAHSVDCIF